MSVSTFGVRTSASLWHFCSLTRCHKYEIFERPHQRVPSRCSLSESSRVLHKRVQVGQEFLCMQRDCSLALVPNWCTCWCQFKVPLLTFGALPTVRTICMLISPPCPPLFSLLTSHPLRTSSRSPRARECIGRQFQQRASCTLLRASRPTELFSKFVVVVSRQIPSFVSKSLPIF